MSDLNLNLDNFDNFEEKTDTKPNYDETKIVSSYSDYNLLFKEDTVLLGDGFHDKTTTTESRFDTHPRTLIYYIIMATLLTANFLFLAQIWLCIINILAHVIIVAVAAFMKCSGRNGAKKIYYLERQATSVSPKEQEQNIGKLSCEEIKLEQSDKHFRHSYTNAMNWILGISNTYGTVPTWLSWFLPVLMLYCEVILLIVLLVWGTKTAPGKYCKNGYPLASEPDFKTGGCFVQKEIGLFFGLCALLGIVISLGTLYDISPQSMKSIELAKKRITNLFDTNPFTHDYFTQIDVQRERLVIPLHKKKTFYVILGVNVVWSLHLLYWEPVLIYEISKPYLTAAILLYVLIFIGFAVASYCVVESMYTNKNIYKHYWVIMQMFARPLRVDSLDDIRSWMEMRKLQMNYYMVIYFGVSNGVVVSYVVIELICVLIGVYWAFLSPHGFHIGGIGTLAISVAGVIFTGFILRIFAMCADISNIKQLHVSMLQQEQQRLRWILYRKDNDESVEKLLKAIDEICEELTLHDKSPRIVGVPMTWSLYNIMLAYAVSGCVSILSATFIQNN